MSCPLHIPQKGETFIESELVWWTANRTSHKSQSVPDGLSVLLSSHTHPLPQCSVDPPSCCRYRVVSPGGSLDDQYFQGLGFYQVLLTHLAKGTNPLSCLLKTYNVIAIRLMADLVEITDLAEMPCSLWRYLYCHKWFPNTFFSYVSMFFMRIIFY